MHLKTPVSRKHKSMYRTILKSSCKEETWNRLVKTCSILIIDAYMQRSIVVDMIV